MQRLSTRGPVQTKQSERRGPVQEEQRSSQAER